MKRRLVFVNAAAIGIVLGVLAAIGVNALRAREPWTLSCYACKNCTATCPLGIDPQGFVTAALAGRGDVYVYATNIRVSAANALALDPKMIVSAGDRRMTAEEATQRLRLRGDAELMTYRMQARHAAGFCLRCGACEKSCVLKLPLLRAIERLREPATTEASHER